MLTENIEQLSALNELLDHLDEDFRNKLISKGEVLEMKHAELLTKQYDLGKYFHFLLDGEVEFFIRISGEREDLSVGASDKPLTPIGWSGFRPPHRYATTVVCNKECKIIRWTHADIRSLINENVDSGLKLLKFIVFKSQIILDEVRLMLTSYDQVRRNNFFELDKVESLGKEKQAQALEVLKRSPFFEIFNEKELSAFACLGTKKLYPRGEKVYLQDDKAKSFDLLLRGKVVIIYSNNERKESFSKRTISNDGYVVGWGNFTEDICNDVSCVSLVDSTILHLENDKLFQFLDDNPETAIKFYFRLLWLISNRLRAARAQLISNKYEREIVAVKNLIEQNTTLLSVNSSLHKVPHLLAHTYTLGDALDTLEHIKRTGNSLERSLSVTSMEILSEVYSEHRFYAGLTKVYDAVVTAPESMSHEEIRRLCARQFIDVFNEIPYVLEGEENLPDEASIFIYNHLANHPYNTLPNSFQITLDSHFISSVILYRKYNNPGIRVVRVPRGEEYGHQYYYERLGHIPVYTSESEKIEETKEEKIRRREYFYKTASEYLTSGTSVLLGPEGTSLETKDSPGQFKAGAFRLAAYMEKEPLIVPVAVANFDKRINRDTFAAVIKKPFKISEKVENPNNKNEMFDFIEKYRKEYRGYVEEAIAISKKSSGNIWEI